MPQERWVSSGRTLSGSVIDAQEYPWTTTIAMRIPQEYQKSDSWRRIVAWAM